MRIKHKSLFSKEGAHHEYRIENKADETTVYVYDEIGWMGVDAGDFVKDFNAITSGTIHMRVNSPGGSVFDGTTIYNAVKQHPSKVIAHIDGLAASIASIIVLAADEVQMADNAFFMVHEPWSIMAGSSDDFRKEADLLDKVRGTIAKTYMDKSGKGEDEIYALMKEETWLTADEALEAGFIDSIYEQDKASSGVDTTLFDLTVFEKVPDQLQAKTNKITAKEIETALRNAGCTQKQAKVIISEGFRSDQRDVADMPDDTAKAEDQRDVASPEQPGSVEDLLIRAELIAPGGN